MSSTEYKHETIKKYAKEFALSTLVETGTCFGDTIAAVRDSFSQIYSIELSRDLFAQAKYRFRNDPGVHLLCGDSPFVLAGLLPLLPKDCLFYLDAHYYSGGGVPVHSPVPTLKELDVILSARPEAQILIDDAGYFGHDKSFPTMEALKALTKKKALTANFWVDEPVTGL